MLPSSIRRIEIILQESDQAASLKEKNKEIYDLQKKIENIQGKAAKRVRPQYSDDEDGESSSEVEEIEDDPLIREYKEKIDRIRKSIEEEKGDEVPLINFSSIFNGVRSVFFKAKSVEQSPAEYKEIIEDIFHYGVPQIELNNVDLSGIDFSIMESTV